MKIQRLALMLPLYTYISWFVGKHRDLNNIAFKLIAYDSINAMDMYQFKLEVLKSSPWKASPYKKEFNSDLSQPIPISKFAVNLFYGNLMAFLPNSDNVKLK